MIKPYYETPNDRLYHGSCEDILPELEWINLICCDPPYGIKRDKGFGKAEGFRGFGKPIYRRNYADNWDFERLTKGIFDLILKHSNSALIFGGNFFADLLPISTHWIVWDKKNIMPTFGDAELIWTNIDRKSVKIFECEYNGLIGKEGKRVHPTQKPIKLLISLLEKYSKLDDLICDPLAGSGTLGIACERLNRKYILIEKELEYCEISKQRISREIQQTKLW